MSRRRSRRLELGIGRGFCQKNYGVWDLPAVVGVGHAVLEPARMADGQRPELTVEPSGQQHSASAGKQVAKGHLGEAALLMHVLSRRSLEAAEFLAVHEELPSDVFAGVVRAHDERVGLDTQLAAVRYVLAELVQGVSLLLHDVDLGPACLQAGEVYAVLHAFGRSWVDRPGDVGADVGEVLH